mgnify:CR=1 FL=1
MHKIPESVLVVIHTADLEVLLIERADKPGFWQSVTGSLDAVDEPLIDTATRELREETGIDATAHGGLADWQMSNDYEIFPQWKHRYPPGTKFNTEHVFGLMLPHPVPVQLAPRDHVASLSPPCRQPAAPGFASSHPAAL